VELREFAERVIATEDLAIKLAPARGPLTDEGPGPTTRVAGPGRPPGLDIRPAREVRVPGLDGMTDPHQRPRILHALANHELQATELFAWAVLAFPDTPHGFRDGLATILQDEQRHTRMYISRVEAMGHAMGDFPVSGYFWNKVPDLRSPTDFICAMSLTFENANLDHTVEYATLARKAGDPATAAVIDRIEKDEIEHVRFGWIWLAEFKRDDETMWDAYRRHLSWPLRPAKARGRSFNHEGRRAAGLDDEFIRRLEESES